MKSLFLFAFFCYVLPLSAANTCILPDTSKPSMRTFAGFPPHLIQKAAYYHLHYNKQYTPDTIKKEDQELLRDGDIVLRQGMGAMSDMLADLMNEPMRFSHSGILWRDTTSQQWMVIHTLPGESGSGFKVETLENFATEAVLHTLTVVRPKRATATDGKRMVQVARNLMKRNIPFDFFFNSDDPSRLYCSEMISTVLQTVFQTDLMPLRIKADVYEVVAMSNFLNPDNFSLVFSRFSPLYQMFKEEE